MKLGKIGLILICFIATPALAGVADSRHNLGTSNTISGANKFSGTGELCVFCHTPHGGDTTAPVPLWNRNLGNNTYQTYDQLGTSTLDGAIADVGSISIACLSCHDGTQAIDSVINEPGSGLVNSGFQNGTWSGDNIGSDGRLLGNVITNIGTDLRNDHPIGVQYGGGGLHTGNPTGPTNDRDFKSPTTMMINSTMFWYVDVDNDSDRESTDVILYSRPGSDFGNGNTLEPSVECGSCHDPHTTENPTFLRVSNNGSGLCLACHTK